MQRLILATAVTVLLAPISLAQTLDDDGHEIGCRGLHCRTRTHRTGSDAGEPRSEAERVQPEWRCGRLDRRADHRPHSGQIQQVVIGVGGFLGIGEKRVAVPFNQLTVKPVAVRVAPVTAVPPDGIAVPPVATAPAPGSTATAPAGTSPAGATRSEEHFAIDMTKDQLKAAPEYRYPERR